MLKWWRGLPWPVAKHDVFYCICILLGISSNCNWSTQYIAYASYMPCTLVKFFPSQVVTSWSVWWHVCFLIIRTVNTDGFKPNLETQLNPLLATEAEKTSSKSNDKYDAASKDAHHPLLMQVSVRSHSSVMCCRTSKRCFTFTFSFSDIVKWAGLSGWGYCKHRIKYLRHST